MPKSKPKPKPKPMAWKLVEPATVHFARGVQIRPHSPVQRCSAAVGKDGYCDLPAPYVLTVPSAGPVKACTVFLCPECRLQLVANLSLPLDSSTPAQFRKAARALAEKLRPKLGPVPK